ncbi:MAG: arginine repressor [Oscillospiraceae bacterium]|jgi:transcriptional regulator of arginine metabolism|nr:arginine repressor [Oscillospiraceae bacterium]
MTKKNLRQNTIMEVIAGEVIDTQELLTARLVERGFHATQATVSRDIKEMRLIKTPLEFGGSRYSAPSSVAGDLASSSVSERLRRIFAQSALSFTQAQNLVVVKTMPGAAQTACEAVDTMGMPEIVGTLGGDNTFIIIARDSADVPPILERLRVMRGDGLGRVRHRREAPSGPDE